MGLLKLNTARNRVFSFVGVSLTSLSVTISKDGAAFGAIAGTLSNITGNYYKLALAAGDTDTLGDLAYKFVDTVIGVVVPNGEDVDQVGPPDVTLADGVSHGGTTAKLRLGSSNSTPAFHATSSGGNAVTFSATGLVGGSGLFLQGDTGGGSGLFVKTPTDGGPAIYVQSFTDVGIYAESFGTGAAAMRLRARGSGNNTDALRLSGGDLGGTAIRAEGGLRSAGILIIAGGNDGSGFASHAGIEISGGDAGDDPGEAAGAALKLIGGNSGTGHDGGNALLAQTDTADAISIQATGSGKHDVRLDGSGDILGNLTGTIDGLTAAGLATLFTVNSTKVYADAVTGSPVKEITNGTGSLTAAMTESYAADGAPMTPAQALHMIWSLLAERNVSSTTLTAKKLDGSTTAMTFTLNNATQPTGQTRST